LFTTGSAVVFSAAAAGLSAAEAVDETRGKMDEISKRLEIAETHGSEARGRRRRRCMRGDRLVVFEQYTL